ncbi:ArnT family glycosyltransferase [Vallitalea okinawensis]|uniref:ArnT family glycosyltransferase n=1 Tax=Vallitalea okinawensis TaxID=2078660 RepID=UPI000CFA9252|nr:glycosyltransferase family 39 protein [Vallitalea okinawensis]
MKKLSIYIEKESLILLLYLIIYFLINLLFLDTFPFVHSDEPWLSGLTRNMLATGDLGTTETFFNLYPRYPHAIKILFHLFQMPFYLLLGYNITSFRLMSLLFSIACLYSFYKILIKLQVKTTMALMITILLSLNIQYIYTSHMARQEIVILLFFLLAFNTYLKPFSTRLPSWLILGSIIGLSIGIHPNSFILAVTFGCLYLYDIATKERTFKELIYLIITVTCFALLFVAMSLSMNTTFLHDYLSYGSQLGITMTLQDKIMGIVPYYLKLFKGISGTYFIPPIQLELIVITCLWFVAFIYGYFKKNHTFIRLALVILAIQIAFIIVGRYNATYVIFIFPFAYMNLAKLLDGISIAVRKGSLILLSMLTVLCIFSVIEDVKIIKTSSPNTYDQYLEKIAQYVAPSDKVLANLNCEYYFDNGQLLDYRNLAYLDNETFEEYIRNNHIKYILYPEEMDYIYRNVNWQILYGDMIYYEDMKNYINNNCQEVGSLTSPLYGIRIVKYMMDYDWQVTIYRTDVVE